MSTRGLWKIDLVLLNSYNRCKRYHIWNCTCGMGIVLVGWELCLWDGNCACGMNMNKLAGKGFDEASDTSWHVLRVSTKIKQLNPNTTYLTNCCTKLSIWSLLPDTTVSQMYESSWIH